MACLLASPENMSSCERRRRVFLSHEGMSSRVTGAYYVTRRHIFPWRRRIVPPVTEGDISSCVARRHVFFLLTRTPSGTCLLMAQNRMTQTSFWRFRERAKHVQVQGRSTCFDKSPTRLQSKSPWWRRGRASNLASATQTLHAPTQPHSSESPSGEGRRLRDIGSTRCGGISPHLGHTLNTK